MFIEGVVFERRFSGGSAISHAQGGSERHGLGQTR